MERIKVVLPPTFNFSTTIVIRITDLNYGGHVGNDVFLVLAHEARQQFLHQYGYTELDFGGAGLIMADAAIEFKRELIYRDEVKVSVAASGFDKLGFDFHYLIEVKAGETWLLAGKVKTGMVCYNYEAKKRVPVPVDAVQKINTPV